MSSRAYVVELPPPVRPLAQELGTTSFERLNRSGKTYLLRTHGGPVVVKLMRGPARLDPGRSTFERLGAEPFPIAPRLLHAVPESEKGPESEVGWYGFFEYVVGQGGTALDLAAMAGLLHRLHASTVVPPWSLERWWLGLLRTGLDSDRDAQPLLDQLEARLPVGPQALTHGDLNLTNIVLSAAGPRLVDWEETGAAARGFDGGWLLALARAGVTFPWPTQSMMDVLVAEGAPEENLRWFERLGLLRLLYRTRTMVMSDPLRQLVEIRVRHSLNEVT